MWKMKENTWIKYYEKPILQEPVAVVGSSGLRSIGRLVIESLVDILKPRLIAELYSTHFPVVYQKAPSYAPDPKFPGLGGTSIEKGKPIFPRVEFYLCDSPPLIITQGYHADFEGQLEVAQKVLDLYEEMKVKRIIVVAGYTKGKKDICCAATDLQTLNEMKQKYDIDMEYQGPFYGFSGLVFGFAKLKEIEAICLFGKTEPVFDDPQFPDEDASEVILKHLLKILHINV